MKVIDHKRSQSVRVIVVVSIMLTLAAVHWFRIGSYLSGELFINYYSYASDLMLPFGAYFLLSMNEIQLQFLRKWVVKIIIVFSVMTFSEVMQLFNVHFFGVTFDLIDIIMYGVGTLLAAFFDKLIFERFIPLWRYNYENE